MSQDDEHTDKGKTDEPPEVDKAAYVMDLMKMRPHVNVLGAS